VLPLDVMLGEDCVLAPDVLWYADGRVPDAYSPPPYPLPDIAVEVRSPSTWSHDVGPKKAAYELAGLPELWLVDTPARSVMVFRRSRPDDPEFDLAAELRESDSVTSSLLPGFALAIAEVFRGL